MQHFAVLQLLAYSVSTPPRASPQPRVSTPPRAAVRMSAWDFNNVLVLDHVNMNHEKGRHDLVKAFYFDVLGLTVDPRKAENLELGRKGVWANAGITQFHLPEADAAQVLDGSITLVYSDLAAAKQRCAFAPEVLAGTNYSWVERSDWAQGSCELHVTCPWGTHFVLRQDVGAYDARGAQPGEVAADCFGIADVCVHVPSEKDLAAVGRYYSQVLGCPIETPNRGELAVRVGPKQTLTFRPSPDAAPVAHEDLRDDDEGVANYGIHLSLYVADLEAAYERAAALAPGIFVNWRFKRRAHTLEEAAEQCMFRVLDVVDPAAGAAAKPIIRLEHEVRSCVKTDGKKYRSCPFDEVPATSAAARSAALYSRIPVPIDTCETADECHVGI